MTMTRNHAGETSRRLVILLALAVALGNINYAASAPIRKKIPASTRVLKGKLKEEDKGHGWHEWLHAFELADTDSNGKLSLDDIPSLYKEHFNKIMASTPHPTNPEAVTREEESVFLEDAELFRKYIERNGTPGTHEFTFDDFKKLMLNYMHVTADLLNARREL